MAVFTALAPPSKPRDRWQSGKAVRRVYAGRAHVARRTCELRERSTAHFTSIRQRVQSAVCSRSFAVRSRGRNLAGRSCECRQRPNVAHCQTECRGQVRNCVGVVSPDLQCCNGVIHIVDRCARLRTFHASVHVWARGLRKCRVGALRLLALQCGYTHGCFFCLLAVLTLIPAPLPFTHEPRCF